MQRRLGQPGHRAAAARDLRALLPALLALPEPADLQGGLAAGSSQVTKFKDRMVELNQQIALGARARQGRPVRQVAVQRARLVDQPQPLLGHPIPVWKSRRPGVPADRRLRVDRRAGARLRGAGRPICTGPYIDELTRPNPDDPTGRSTMRRVEDVLDVLVRLRVDAVRPGALPVREPRLVRAPLPGRLHRRVHRADPRLVLHAAHPGDGPVRPAGVRELHEPRHRAGQRRPEDEQVAAATTRTSPRSSTATAPTRCAGS